MFWEQSVQYAALSDIGFCRQNNQDAWVVHLRSDREQWTNRGHLFIVADGMGGHAVGELASKLAIDTIPHTFDKLRQLPPMQALKAAIEDANSAINTKGQENKDFLRMGTTCTTLLLGPLGAVIGHVGDSRAYRIRRLHIDQLTSDHSLLWEMIRQRKMNPAEAERLCPRNVITRSLGPDPTVRVDLEGPHPVLPGDTFLLCSDGLCGQLTDAEMGMVAAHLPPSAACRLLVNLANLRGGPDNITVIVVRAGDVPDEAPSIDLPQQFNRQELGWGSFAAWCGIAAMFCIGLSLAALTEKTLPGLFLIAGSVLALTFWGLFVRRHLLAASATAPGFDPHATVAWRPYRTASARIQPQFVEKLARMESELTQAAHEDGWPIDWKQHEQASRRARESLAAKQWQAALAGFADCLDILMAGVQWQRKQMQHEARWGKSPTPLPKNRE